MSSIITANFKPYFILNFINENNEITSTDLRYFDFYDYNVYIEHNKNLFKFNGIIAEMLKPLELLKNPVLIIDQHNFKNLEIEFILRIPANIDKNIRNKNNQSNKKKEYLERYIADSFGQYIPEEGIPDIPENAEWLNKCHLFNVDYDNTKVSVNIGLCFIGITKINN